mmetsp:Transcript_5666/g.21361  ORF Transcript_5666/g.21361 Transcript_5666/m.21361 type:complete len:211 (+) Transcript_5666:1908-2540(+)
MRRVRLVRAPHRRAHEARVAPVSVVIARVASEHRPRGATRRLRLLPVADVGERRGVGLRRFGRRRRQRDLASARRSTVGAGCASCAAAAFGPARERGRGGRGAVLGGAVGAGRRVSVGILPGAVLGGGGAVGRGFLPGGLRLEPILLFPSRDHLLLGSLAFGRRRGALRRRLAPGLVGIEHLALALAGEDLLRVRGGRPGGSTAAGPRRH